MCDCSFNTNLRRLVSSYFPQVCKSRAIYFFGAKSFRCISEFFLLLDVTTFTHPFKLQHKCDQPVVQLCIAIRV